MNDSTAHQAASSRRGFQVFVLIGILIVLVSFAMLLFRQKKTAGNGNIENRRNAINTVSTSMNLPLFPDYYVLRNYNPNPQDTLHDAPDTWIQRLATLKDDELIGIRCSEKLVHEGNVFFVRSFDTHRPIHQIIDPVFSVLLQKVHDTAISPRTVLTARVCETDQGEVMIEYTDGMQTYIHPDEGTQTRTFFSIMSASSFVPGVPIVSQDVWPYPGCLTPYALTKDKKLYLGCKVPNETGYKTTYHLVDFMTQSVQTVLTCTMTYAPKPVRTCQ